MPSNLFQSIQDFLSNVWRIISDGLLLFGGPVDTFLAIIDILATAFVIYYILKLLRDTRAWQLLRGLLLIFAFGIFASMVGLDTIGFLLNRTISLFAIAFVVIFQPELRRALETFGRSSFNVLASTFSAEDRSDTIHQLIESIVSACDALGKSKAGALIIIERQTKLGELQDQENAVSIDAQVTSSLLQQIFYQGSPLHDGAVLIRGGRVSAARVHVPLSDNYHLRREFGTRHRAAVGASEMGDAISVVVSEERGTISIAVDGKLYVLSNADALRTQLHRLLSAKPEEKRTGLGRLWVNRQDRIKKQKAKQAAEVSETAVVSAYKAEESDAKENIVSEDPTCKGSDDAGKESPNTAEKAERYQFASSDKFSALNSRRRGIFKRRKQEAAGTKKKVLLYLVSLLIAFGIWIYVQITINPIDTRNYTVQLQYRNKETAADNGFGVQSYPLETVQVRLRGRQRLLQDLSANDIVAFVDLGQITEEGMQDLPVEIDTGTVFYTDTEQLLPERITINVFSEDNP
ncbi:MAG TPA: TIGR00159 family protein [Clostridiaceae bacterium]|nr:TIGR00159 family protein [Clostridiaceae bacterium]